MFDGFRDNLAARRLKPGSGKPLPRFRWWQLLSRSLFAIDLRGDDGVVRSYAVDVRQMGDDDDGEVRARLYTDGVETAVSKLPARLPVPGGVLDVRAGNWGMKRMHLVRADGTEQLLTPEPRSAEGRRARLERTHPRASRVVGLVTTVIIVLGAILGLPQLLETITDIPPIAEHIGTFDSPIDLPLQANIAIGVVTALASVERALRLRSTWLDDLAN